MIQFRNMAPLGGNLVQRMRCSCFRDTTWLACSMGNRGISRSAREGLGRAHAVRGTSEACIAIYSTRIFVLW
jgi:xanthine dehydrogenase YagS FAD-binding subunit